MPDVFVADSTKKTTDPISTPPKKADVKSVQDPTDIITAPHADSFKKGHHLFSAFGVDPEDLTFTNQEKDEKVLLFLRKSMLTNIGWEAISVILLIIPLFVLPFVNLSHPPFFLTIKHIIFFTLFYYLLIFSYAFTSFITWYFNIGIITNIRVVDIDFTNLVFKNIAATKLSLVQDVSFQQIGALRALFDYGDVMVQTAGNVENFEFAEVPQPENAVHIMEDLIGKYARL